MKHLIVIGSYPEKGSLHGKKVVGGATYTKITLLALKKQYPDLAITVLAEELPKNTPSPYPSPSGRGNNAPSPLRGEGRDEGETYEEDGITIKRVWKRSTLSYPFTLLKELSKTKGDQILIEFELSLFGTSFYLLPFPLFLLALKLMGKAPVMVLHQVIDNFSEISEHMNIPSKSLVAHIYSALLTLFYKQIIFFSSKLIVFEEVFKKRLQKMGGLHIVVIPHAVEAFEASENKKQSREKINISNNKFILMLFGFLAWYKGTDWAIELFKPLPNSDYFLLIAGGPNPNHIDKPFYQNYILALEESQNDNIKVTGFIPEQNIASYFLSSDVIIFPYRTLMSSSGPLSFALSFGKPILLSSALSPILETHDAKEVLESLKLDKNDLVFTGQKDFIEKIIKLENDESQRDKLIAFAKELARKRSWNTIAKKYYEVLFI